MSQPYCPLPCYYTYGSLRSGQGLTLVVSPFCSNCRTRMPALTEEITWVAEGSNSPDPISFLFDLLLPPHSLRDSLPLLQLWLLLHSGTALGSPPRWLDPQLSPPPACHTSNPLTLQLPAQLSSISPHLQTLCKSTSFGVQRIGRAHV